MFEVALLIVANLVIALFIGFVLGFLIAKLRNQPVIEAIGNDSFEIKFDDLKSKQTLNPIFKKSSSLDFKPLVLSAPRFSGKDNLKKIKGINSKIENDLNTIGIYHFDQIARWSNKNSEWIESFLGIPSSVKNNQWVDQAKILITGAETIYSQKVIDGEIEVD